MSSLNLNKVILVGRLTAKPELKQTPSGVSFIRFTVAVNRRRTRSAEQTEQQADFISVIAWRQTAEFISKYFEKGNAICITGSIQTSNWTDTQGQKRYSTEVVADEAMFVDSRGETSSVSNDAYSPAQSYASSEATAQSFEAPNTDDDLPF